jgi:phosphate-selective porin OprO/OprP
LSESAGFNLTGRITGLPYYVDKGKIFLHLGLSYSRQFRNNDTDSDVKFRTRPESRITDQRLVDTGKLLTDRGDRIGIEFAKVLGPLSIQAEYLLALENGSVDLNFQGYYLYCSYFITGEIHRYKMANGTFTGVVPINNFHPLKGEWGALELGLRHSYLDLNDGNIKGGKERNITAGLNWYLSSKNRFMFNYIRANLEDRDTPFIDDGSADIFQVRFQFAY